jgi:nucleoside-diphosphate-sugar epimerase
MVHVTPTSAGGHTGAIVNVLVTGATGRIGSHVTRQLLESGRTVRALVEPGDVRRDRIEGAGVTVVEGSLADEAALREAVTGVDAVIHLAALLTTHGHADDFYFDGNVVATNRLLTVIRDHAGPLSRFVYVSSDAVYWEGGKTKPEYLPIDEKHPRNPGSAYGVSKYMAEELCHTFSRMHGVPVTIIRPSATADAAELIDSTGVFGKRMFVSETVAAMEASDNAIDTDLLASLRQIDDGTPRLFVLASEDGTTNQTTLNDARQTANCIVLAMDAALAVGETFNAGPAAGYDEAAFITYLGERLGVPVVKVPSPNARSSWVVGSAKAMEMLDYRPTRTPFAMVDEALAAKAAAG